MSSAQRFGVLLVMQAFELNRYAVVNVHPQRKDDKGTVHVICVWDRRGIDAEAVDKCIVCMLQFKVNMDICKVTTAVRCCDAQETRF